jgi:hypothetical protein
MNQTHRNVSRATITTPDDLPVYDYRGLIAHLGQLTRNTVNFAGRHFDKPANLTPVQHRAFELLATPIPLSLT